MEKYVTLLGAEDVQRAGNTMCAAADRMQFAANSISDTADRQQRYMEEWMERFERAVDKLVEGRQDADNTKG